MNTRDTDRPSFEELLGAWRRRMEDSGKSANRADGASNDEWGDWSEWLGDDSKLKKQVAEMDSQMQLMARTINMLLDRVTVLERLAVQDERRLAEEIEKLRR